MFTFVFTSTGRLNVTIDGKPYIVETDHPNYSKMLDVLKQRNPDAVAFTSLIDIPKVVHNYSQGLLEVRDGNVFVTYEGESRQVDNSAARTLLELMDKGLPVDSFANFVIRLMQNPSRSVVMGLWTLLQHMVDNNDGVTIDQDGWIVAYKRLKADYTSYHDGTFAYPKPDNGPVEIRIPRNETDENALRECSYGLHFGGFRYLRSFHNIPGSLTLVVKVDPADVVSVPEGNWKLRTTAMTIVEPFCGVVDGVQFINGIKPDPNAPKDAFYEDGEVALRPYEYRKAQVVITEGEGLYLKVVSRRSDPETNRFLLEAGDGSRKWFDTDAISHLSPDQNFPLSDFPTEDEDDEDDDETDDDGDKDYGNLHIYVDRDVDQEDVNFLEDSLDLGGDEAPDEESDTGSQTILHYQVSEDAIEGLVKNAKRFNFVRQVTTGTYTA